MRSIYNLLLLTLFVAAEATTTWEPLTTPDVETATESAQTTTGRMETTIGFTGTMEPETTTEHHGKDTTHRHSTPEWTTVPNPDLIPCGTTLESSEGYLNSPNYPRGYPAGMSCGWRIKTPNGTHVEFTFEGFDLEENRDFLYLYDGADCQGQYFKRMTGQEKLITLNTTTNSLILFMTTCSKSNSTGFKIKYTAVPGGVTVQDTGASLDNCNTHTQVTTTEETNTPISTTEPKPFDPIPCGYTIHGEFGWLYSLNYPQHYPVNKTCSWRMKTPRNTHMVFTFDEFDLEFNKDFLYVYDGADCQDGYIARFTGQHKELGVISRTNSLIFHMTSDGSGTGKGFHGTFRYVLGGITADVLYNATMETCNLNPAPTTESTAPETTTEPIEPGSTTEPIETETTTNYTEPETTTGSIEPEVTTEPIEPGSTTEPIETETTTNYTEPETTTGSMEPGVTTTTPSEPPFSTDKPVFVKVECGETLKCLSGTLPSPNYPNPYPANLTCAWRIYVPENMHIEFEADEVQLEKWNDKLYYYDGGDCKKGYDWMYTGYYKHLHIDTRTNVLVLYMTTDESVELKGFLGRYKAVWGGEVATVDPTAEIGDCNTNPGYK